MSRKERNLNKIAVMAALDATLKDLGTSKHAEKKEATLPPPKAGNGLKKTIAGRSGLFIKDPNRIGILQLDDMGTAIPSDMSELGNLQIASQPVPAKTSLKEAWLKMEEEYEAREKVFKLSQVELKQEDFEMVKREPTFLQRILGIDPGEFRQKYIYKK